MDPPLRLIGADGCPGGWMVALEFADRTTALERWSTPQLGWAAQLGSVAIIVIDIPIGLSAAGPRACDLEARQLLGHPRSSSVFPAPLRRMLAATGYQQAQSIRQAIEGTGCSRQAFGIQAKVAEVDQLLRHQGAEKLREGHPELSFRRLAGGASLPTSKHRREGRITRWELVRAEFPEVAELDPERASSADSLDAYACLATARRIAAGTASSVPAGLVQLDPELQVPMRIWF
ncbi:MAG: DUF429 domain-containing protein [Candidatus Dormibacteria bacterium]